MRITSFIILLLIVTTCVGQRGFKEQIAIELDEPNQGFNVVEDTINKQFLVSGVYFDQTIGRWTASVSAYRYNGDLTGVHTLQSDTIPLSGFSDQSVLENNDYYIYGAGSTTNNILCYNTTEKAFTVPFSHERFDNIFNKNLGVWSFLLDENQRTGVFVGAVGLDRNGVRRGAVFYRMGDRNQIYVDTSESKNLIALNTRRNSSGYIVAAALSSVIPLDASQDTSFIYILDNELNLIRNTIDYNDNPNFRLGKGMAIDSEDNIVVTGAKRSPGGGTVSGLNLQGVVKFDREGRYLWTSYISNSINNVSGWGKWHSIVESHDRDGYVLAGSESYQTEAQDTMVSKAAIAKISRDGDSLWMHTFSYREGLLLREEFHDIATTSDGGYIVVGTSANFEPFDEILLPWVRTIVLKVDKDGLLDTTLVSVLDISSEENNLSIYPNPVIGDHLYITQSLDQDLRITVYNTQGQLVDNYRSDNAQHTIILDVAAYDPGMYIVTATNDKGDKYSRKFVVE
jgi:hypothetical protein